MVNLIQPRYDVPIGRTSDGKPVMPSREFMDYIAQQLFLRVGGHTAPSNTDLDTSVGEVQAAEMQFPPVLPEVLLSDFTQPMPAPDDRLPDIVQPLPGPSQGAAMSITPGASPYTYSASTAQCVVVRGGTVTTISYVRNGALTLLGSTSGAFELQPGDGLRIAYSVVPTMNAIPR